jgi:proteasome lid subunit RPN8/RPN11
MHPEDIPEEELHENHEEHLESRWKKPLVWSMGGFMILLMLSFVFVTYPIGPILEGKIESNLIKNNQIDVGEFTIFFEGNSYDKLLQVYNPDLEYEISLCLLGTKKGDDYIVSSLYEPKIYEQTFDHVSFEACNQETIVMLHSHPYKRCVASNTDINTLASTQKVNPDVVMVVMCEPDRFSVYR